jgi:drug/metabolite transporter (DMT)-like permease
MLKKRIPVGPPGRADQAAGILAMVGCALLWSTAGIFIKLLDWQPFAIAGIRSAIAALFLFFVLRGRLKLSFSPVQLWSALAYAATMLLFVLANKLTTSANAILLQYGAPVYVAFLGALFLKEYPRPEHWFALVAVCGGMLLFFADSLGKGNFLGDLVAVGAGIAFAFNIVLLRKQKDARPLDSMLLGHIFTALFALPLSIGQPLPTINPGSIFSILMLGVFQIGIAAVLFSYGIKRITALQSILTAIIEPLFNPVWVFLATREVPGSRSVAGGIVIVSAVIISSLITVRRSAKSLQ